MSDLCIKERIDQILFNVDFISIEKVMKILDWTYLNSEHTPTISELIETAKTCLTNAITLCEYNSECTYFTGGFYAECAKDGNGDVVALNLLFALTSWHTD